ncbi:MAG: zinc-binding dehydrogenase [bacterium]|nr:zinc-binding dehydrogenase [bacterium]
MKAAVLYKTGSPLVVEEGIEIPELMPGQVLVKLRYSGICHSQLMEVRGYRGKDKYLPHLLGHEGSGKVTEIGEKVSKVKVGDYVILGWIRGEGEDVTGAEYKKGDITINSGAVVTFSEYAVVSENRCVKLPEGVPLDVAVLFGCALPTGAGIVINEISLKKENSIAIFGLGGIGLSALIATRMFENRMVIAVDVEEEKLKTAKEFGATHFVNSAKKNPVEAIRQITGGTGVDYSIESAGLTTTIEQAFHSVRINGGVCIFASHPKDGDTIKLNPHDLISGKQIRGTWGGNCKPDRDIPVFAKHYLDGRLPLEKLISHRYSLHDINQALDDLEARKINRALIEIDTNKQ